MRSSGSAFGCVVIVPVENAKAEGTVKRYSFINPLSGNTVSRWFCTGCGSHLLSQSSNRPHSISVKAGNIDAFTKLPVVLEVFTKDRWPSISPVEGALQVEGSVVRLSDLKQDTQSDSASDKISLKLGPGHGT
ncbi:hypothetical protein AX15_006160 [Amanita polypyramis BW_CC]|nr:hypothetical protein AX15_006160 [Amanita polypyramis BW_CC]